VPGKNAFAGSVARRLRERARAGHRALADVEPVALKPPLRNVAHPNPLPPLFDGTRCFQRFAPESTAPPLTIGPVARTTTRRHTGVPAGGVQGLVRPRWFRVAGTVDMEADMPLARVVSFDGVSSARMAEMQQEMRGGERPENVPAKEIVVLHDPEAEKSLVILFFDNEDDYRKGDAALNAMPAADTPGTRTAVTKYDVAFRMTD